jgi:hypothetical protein
LLICSWSISFFRIFIEISAAELSHSLFMGQYIFYTNKFLSHKDLYSTLTGRDTLFGKDRTIFNTNEFRHAGYGMSMYKQWLCLKKWGHCYEHLRWTPMFSKNHKMQWKAIQFMISNWAIECLQQMWFLYFSGLSSVTWPKHSDLLLKLRSQVAHSSFPV